MNIKNIDSLSLEECQKLLAANPNDERIQNLHKKLEIKDIEEKNKKLKVEIQNLDKERLREITKLQKELSSTKRELATIRVQRDYLKGYCNLFKYTLFVTIGALFVSTIFLFNNCNSSGENSVVCDSIDCDSVDTNMALYDINFVDSIQKKIADYKYIIANIPMIVTDIKIGNVYKNNEVETDYGHFIFDSKTMFLKPKITYVGANDGFVTLYYKIQRLSDNHTTVSNGHDYRIDKGKNTLELYAWGNEKLGYWEAGKYAISIWYCDKKIAEDTFDIHKSQDSE